MHQIVHVVPQSRQVCVEGGGGVGEVCVCVCFMCVLCFVYVLCVCLCMCVGVGESVLSRIWFAASSLLKTVRA